MALNTLSREVSRVPPYMQSSITSIAFKKASWRKYSFILGLSNKSSLSTSTRKLLDDFAIKKEKNNMNLYILTTALRSGYFFFFMFLPIR